jgi:hypothetical protein
MKVVLLALCLLFSSFTFADEAPNKSIETCLDHWGTHPFGKKPSYRTMSTSVKVFGIGTDPVDDDVTDKPKLILVSPSVNVMGGTTIALLNPNGWYCLRTNVNVMGGLKIKAHCKAHLTSTTDGATVLGKSDEKGGEGKNRGVTVMGSTHVELVGCKDKDD